MDKETRGAIERVTQRARSLLEDDFAAQLEGDFDVLRGGRIAAKGSAHLNAPQLYQRERIVAAIEHKRAAGMSAADAVNDYLRDAAFTTLNRFVALKMLEARELVQECVTRGELSAGYREFCGLAKGIPLLKDGAGYRLYVECLFDELSTEVKVLFDRRDPSSVLWPKRATFEQLLDILNATELGGVWGEDETIGWVYQYFNGQDERRKMREESQAPRNSRELAVRNQFFTPRYVVQFLTDNTLGRIWYEMRGTSTVLADRCEYMVRKPGEQFTPRAKKDPRDLRVLDPACGSGHFLLYAFDLLLAIYEEAYADPESRKSDATGRTLAEDYEAGIDALRAAMPGLILAHNLHGVDIDARCAQIAQLALWMRAQRAYRDFGVARSERPRIRRSNIVVAEPLVAGEIVVKEFVARLGDAQLARVFTDLVDALKLAGDLGLLLRIETLVARPAKEGQTGDLFAPPEERIRAALTKFVMEEGDGASTRKRLFAEDAAQGMGLLSVAEKKFDVVLMNPPFGDGSMRAKKELGKAYPRTKNDIYAAFVERGIELLASRGRVGAITSRTGFFLASFEKWREDMLSNAPPVVFADLGLGVMDSALVESAAYCLERSVESRGVGTVFLRVLEELHDKASALRNAITSPDASRRKRWFDVRPTSFARVPGVPFAYWVSDSIRDVFGIVPPFESAGRVARQGLATADDFRFVRTWWAVPSNELGSRWFLFAKGGKYSPFYADLHLCVNWEDGGRDVQGYEKSFPRNAQLFSRPGLTWPRRTQGGFGTRAMPSGCIFADKGPAVFIDGDAHEQLLALLALMTSQPFIYLIELQMAFGSYEVGVVQSTPVPDLNDVDIAALAHLARRAWSLKRSLDTTNETSHAFLLPLGLNENQTGLDPGTVERELIQIQKQIDEHAFLLYGIDPGDRVVIDASSRRTIQSNGAVDSDDEHEDPGEGEGFATAPRDTLFSWLVGVAFGRFDPRLVTAVVQSYKVSGGNQYTPPSGPRLIPAEPEPFDPLPSRSPGMWPEDEFPVIVPPDIMVDDAGHDHDIRIHVAEAGAATGCPDHHDLRHWLAREFFPLHIKMYSKSRRKAPIYWQLATPSASYSVWLYIHAFTKDTLFRVQNDYIAPKLVHEERRLDEMTNELREQATAAHRKELSGQETFVEELRAFLEEVKRVAPLWNPDLDDGVIINFAPLWRLVPQHKAWQKELKFTWDALCEGEYDWAHLAMHLWPERVVPKCTSDRSLAIAHGLEDVFWVEGSDGKWTARKSPTRPVEELVRERTAPAVKTALKSLLEAPQPAGTVRKRKKG